MVRKGRKYPQKRPCFWGVVVAVVVVVSVVAVVVVAVVIAVVVKYQKILAHFVAGFSGT